jgi:hypothetical protein
VRAPVFTFFAKKIELSNNPLLINPLKSKNIITEEDNVRNFQRLKLKRK